MAMNDSDVQVYTGESASWVHHAAAGVQEVFDISAVASLGVVWGAVLVGFVCIVSGFLVLSGEDHPPQ